MRMADGFPPGRWIALRRNDRRHGRLSKRRQAHGELRLHAERTAALERVPHWTWEQPRRKRRKIG